MYTIEFVVDVADVVDVVDVVAGGDEL